MSLSLLSNKIAYILFFLIVACIITGINQYLVADVRILNKHLIYPSVFVLYFLSTVGVLKTGAKKLNPATLILVVLLPFALLTISGLVTSWSVLYPYHFPVVTLVVMLAVVLAFKFYKQTFRRQILTIALASIFFFAINFLALTLSKGQYSKKWNNISFNYSNKRSLVKSLKEQLIDTNGRKLLLGNNNYYIFNFSYYSSAPCQVKLQYLKSFARQLPPNIKIVYVANSQLETFDVFKSKLKPDTADRIIYAYLYNKAFFKTLNINKFPTEIMVSPELKLLREQRGFYDFDANSYAQSTFELIKK